MPDDALIFPLIRDATLPVQIVMLLLLCASLLSWFWIFQRGLLIWHTTRSLKEFERTFWSGVDLHTLFNEIENQPQVGGVRSIFFDGFGEFLRLRARQASPIAILEGVQRAMRVAINREEEYLNRGLATLASIASVSPYVGLFGTVWGIMHAFLGLATITNTVSINTVAPGIAEALIATAMGLIAAIPAVLSYNHFNNKITWLIVHYEVFTEEFMAILHRRLHGKSNQ